MPGAAPGTTNGSTIPNAGVGPKPAPTPGQSTSIPPNVPGTSGMGPAPAPTPGQSTSLPPTPDATTGIAPQGIAPTAPTPGQSTTQPSGNAPPLSNRNQSQNAPSGGSGVAPEGSFADRYGTPLIANDPALGLTPGKSNAGSSNGPSSTTGQGSRRR
jgi:hypothetical protein